jgi:hypothetical protein
MSYAPYPSSLPGVYPHYPSQIVLTPTYRCSAAHVICAWVGAVFTLGYLLPWAIGASRNRSNCLAIALVNVFLGWTGLGWFAALVLACLPNPQPVLLVNTPVAALPGPSEQTLPLPSGPTGYDRPRSTR